MKYAYKMHAKQQIEIFIIDNNKYPKRTWTTRVTIEYLIKLIKVDSDPA